MPVELICFSAIRAQPMVCVDEIEVIAGAGIFGDRHFGAGLPGEGRNLTLIEAEEIEAFNARNGTRFALSSPRRNIVMRKERLNALVGATFRIGSARLRATELCEPCGKLARYLCGEGMPHWHFLRELAHRCGLRAEVLESGRIRVGDVLVPD